MSRLSDDIDFRALGEKHARLGIRLAGPAFSVVDGIEYQRGFDGAATKSPITVKTRESSSAP